jgi:hypothetical protein
MSQTISGAIQEAEERLAWLRAVGEQYPDATPDTLPDGTYVWTSASVLPDVTDVHLVEAKGKGIYACAFRLIAEKRLYVDQWKWKYGLVLLGDFKTIHADAYKALVDLTKV